MSFFGDPPPPFNTRKWWEKWSKSTVAFFGITKISNAIIRNLFQKWSSDKLELPFWYMSYFQDVYSVLSAHKLNFEQTQRNGKCHFETFVMFEGGNRQEIHGRKIPKLLSVFFSFLSTLSVKTNRLKAFLLLHTFRGAIILSPKFAILNQVGGAGKWGVS